MLNSEKMICGLELGAGRLKAAAGILDKKGSILRLEYADIKSEGINNGFISDISKLTFLLKQLIGSLEQKIGRRIKRVYVSAKNRDIVFRESEASLPLSERGNKIITASDLSLLNAQARSLSLKMEEDIIHDFALNYVLDDCNRVENPRGLSAHKLSVKLHLIVDKVVNIENTLRLLSQAGLETEEIVFSGLAASLAVLEDSEKQKGCVLVDIGASATELLVFKNGIPDSLDSLDYGGDDITKAVSGAFELNLALAQELKDSHGAAISNDIAESEEVIIKKDAGYYPIKRRLISASIERSLTQFFSRLKEKISLNQSLKGLDYCVVMVGGTSLLDGFLELAEQVLGVGVRLGIPRVQAAIEDQNKFKVSFSHRAVIYATAIGLIQYGANAARRNKLAIFKSKDNNLITHIAGRVKDIYSEYF